MSTIGACRSYVVITQAKIIHSDLRFFAGLVNAALATCMLTVASAMNKAAMSRTAKDL